MLKTVCFLFLLPSCGSGIIASTINGKPAPDPVTTVEVEIEGLNIEPTFCSLNYSGDLICPK
jgi:hypothetical protein